MSGGGSCSPERRCRRRECAHCGPIRRNDEYRKFHENIRAYGGRVVLIAVTAPGKDALPWDPDVCLIEGQHKHSGTLGCRVVRDLADEWNESASKHYATLWKAAQQNADRWLRRLYGSDVKLPRRVAVVWSEQRRGVWHVHEALPAATHYERQWTKLMVEYVDRFAYRYKWGNVDRAPLRDGARYNGSELAARYLARNAATYLAENTAESHGLPGRSLRSYVARRLTTATGCTMRNLRAARYLYVCITNGWPLPEWPADRIEVVWSLLAGASAVMPAGP